MLYSIKRRHLYLILILFNTGFLFLSDAKNAGMPFLREIFILILIVLFGWNVIKNSHWRGTPYEYWVLILVASVVILSPLLAWIKFGQPISYGILEERRVLHYLVFFPIFYGLLKEEVTLDILEKYIIYSFLSCAALGTMYSLRILEARTGVSFQVENGVRDINEIYQGFSFRTFSIWQFVS